jgi:V8-like Glu-specific endopeptidase
LKDKLKLPCRALVLALPLILNSQLSFAIVNGFQIATTTAPAEVRMYFRTGPADEKTGHVPVERFSATRIGPRLYVTCAHCVTRLKVGDDLNVGQFSDLATLFSKWDVWVKVTHTSFNPKWISDSSSAEFDVGLIEIDRELPNVSIALIADAKSKAYSEPVFLAGYGRNGTQYADSSLVPIRGTLALNDSAMGGNFENNKAQMILLPTELFADLGRGKIQPGDSGSGIMNIESDPITHQPAAGKFILGVISKGPTSPQLSAYAGIGARFDNPATRDWLLGALLFYIPIDPCPLTDMWCSIGSINMP